MKTYYISLLLDPIESKIKDLQTSENFERWHYLYITESKNISAAKKEALAYVYDNHKAFCVLNMIIACDGEEIMI